MKAKVIREPYRLANLKIGEIVEIIPGMETDSEGIWNVSAGKLILCKKSDGTFCYSSLLDMEIVDEAPSVDWNSFRRETAKDVVCALLQDNRISYSQPYEWFGKQAILMADELIKQLKEK